MNIDETLARLEAGLAATGERLARLEEIYAEMRQAVEDAKRRNEEWDAMVAGWRARDAAYDARLALEREAAEMGAAVLAQVAVCCPSCGAVGFPCDLPCAFCADAEEAPDKAA
jgi:hypothetical protein